MLRTFRMLRGFSLLRTYSMVRGWAGDASSGPPSPLPTVTGGRAHTLLLKRKRAGLK